MKIYFPHSKQLNYEQYYAIIRNSPFFSKHTCIFPYEKSKNPVNSKLIIESCDLIIAEVSFPGTGLGIELGWADSFGKKIICVYMDGYAIAGSLKIISQDFVIYKNIDELMKKLEKLL